MKKSLFLGSVGVAALMLSGAVLAAAPANMIIDNNTTLSSNAYIHDSASPNVLAPKTAESISWADVTALCHGTTPPLLGGSDSCSFDVYATLDAANPQQIHVATVNMYLSNGDVINIAQLGTSYGLVVKAVAPGQFELDTI